MEAVKPAPSPAGALDHAVAAVADRRQVFARMPPAEKAALLRSTLPRLRDVMHAWAEAGCRAKRITLGTPLSGEEWLAGPMPTVRNVRLLAASLDRIARGGRPALGRRVRTRPDGRVEVEVLPSGGWDAVVHRGLSCWVRLQPGIDVRAAAEKQAGFYQRRDPEGRLALILGAGNVSSIPAMDVLAKMFIDGEVCVLKMNPVNEWAGRFLQHAFEPFIEQGFLRIVYGGAEEGAYLCEHPGVESIHITGSDVTHDRIVWGPPGPDQQRRKRSGQPLLDKPITSELGNVSPVAVVPGRYSESELRFQAKNLVSMLANNASFNCNAAKLLITARGWPQRDRLLELVREELRAVPPRFAYYPGALARQQQLTESRTGVEWFGERGPDRPPWAFIPVDAGDSDEPLFRSEAFCGLLAHTELGEAQPAEFLDSVTRFCNDRLWGTLNAAIIIDPRTEREPEAAAALDRAISELRYGTVAINLWPAVCYGAVSAPWGGHPSATLADIQSGLGWVHNTFMLEGIEKSILRAPITFSPKPVWYHDHRTCHLVGERLTSFELRPGATRFLPLLSAALRG